MKSVTSKKGNFDLEKLASIPTIYFPLLNYAKDKIAFYWDKTGRMELFVMDLGTKEINQISSGEIPKTLRAGYIWSRDDSKILFAKDFDGNEQHDIYSIDIKSKEVTQLTNTPSAQDYIIDSSPDGNWYSILSTRHGQQNLFKMSAKDFSIEQLTAHETTVWGGNISPNGKYVIYTNNEESDLNNQDIYIVKSDGSEVKRILQGKIGSQETFGSWSQDGSFFAFNTDKNGSNQVGIYHIGSSEITYFGDGENDEFVAGITHDMKKLIVYINKNAKIMPVLYDINTREMQTVDLQEGSISAISAMMNAQLIEDRYLYISVTSSQIPSSLIKLNISNGDFETILETNLDEVDGSLFVDDDFIWYPSMDGTKIPAIIYKPRYYDRSKLYPGIIMPHGGPTWQYFRNFSMFAQYFTDLGYVIMFPNVRGSTGFGVDFRDACRMDWGGKDHEDWVAGRKWLIENENVDEKRVGVFGGSYGGYATLVCATKSPDLWKAACSWMPVSHLRNMYELSKPHFKYFLKKQMGDPLKNKELWEERSPLNYVQNIKSRFLLLHGKNDPRCPVEESRNVRDRLLELGRKESPDGDFQYIEFQDEGHGSMSDIKGRIRTFKLVGEFFDKHL